MEESASRKGSVAAPTKPFDLDDVLINELGQFGKFQMMNMLLVMIPIAMSAFMSEYIFSAAALPHRCVIPECECLNVNDTFNPPWLPDVTPGSPDSVDSCWRYQARQSHVCVSEDRCPIEIFDTSRTVPCEEYVYERTNSVVYDFGLECDEWQRALAGTLSSVGTLLVLPLTGFVSDRFGRRIALIVSVFNLAVFGIIRAFSNSYGMYLALQLLQTTFGAGTFSSAYVFAAELVGPKYRVLTSATMSSMFAVGQVILGGVAWAVQPWNYMILAIHIPCLLIVSYYWLLPESIRWLLSKQRFDEARNILERVAKVNKKTISEKSMNELINSSQPNETKDDTNKPSVLKTIFKSRVLRRRVLTTPWWWITTTFVYYGLSINSVVLPFNIYTNYMIISAIEIPGFYTATLVLDRVGRKPTISCGFFVAAACNIAFAFLPDGNDIAGLVLFLIGKFAISIAFTSLYLFTSELYPTEYRHSLLAFSSMIGRIGSITAPLTPALAQYWDGIPSLMFGTMGLISGVLVLTQPETLGTKMPDTLAEAEALGEPSSYRTQT